jgi:hypothetical protein
MHKTPIEARPIVSCINTSTYYTSKYLDSLLQPIVNKLSSVVQSTQDTLRKLLQLTPQPNYILLSADVRSLYPSIPHEYGLKAVKSVLEWFNFDIYKVDFVIDLLHWVLTSNYLTFNEEVYHQISGTAMGTPVAVCYANIVLYYLEQSCLALAPPLYLRYIDDIFAVCANQQQALQIVTQFNCQCPNIQLDAIVISTSVNFLDLTISFDNNYSKIKTKLYQKPTNKYLYIPPTSSHHKHILINMITNELKRYRLYNSDDIDFSNQVHLFNQRLLARGYNSSFLNPLFNSIPSRDSLIYKLLQPSNRQMKKIQPHPVIVMDLPTLSQPCRLKHIIRLPDTIKEHWRFKRAFGTNRLLFANKQGPTLLPRLCQDKPITQNPSVSIFSVQEDRTEEVNTEGNPNMLALS